MFGGIDTFEQAFEEINKHLRYTETWQLLDIFLENDSPLTHDDSEEFDADNIRRMIKEGEVCINFLKETVKPEC